ncbi:MAG: polysaccharide biosynthesis tyrosine autokinase [Thermoguttaceae bacterium]|jgi:capsular exopolysaccharide synthesis family protein|nr:polysaccharide biosynthesis tyrosine autokinase [Thermoguttaceae bacterium]
MHSELHPPSDGRAWSSQQDMLLIHGLLRQLQVMRYRKQLVMAIVGAAVLLGALYYAIATRYYRAEASLLISQSGPNTLNSSVTGEETVRRNTMPTVVNILRSAKVLEGALERLTPEDCIDFAGKPRSAWVSILQNGTSANAIRSTSIVEVSYQSRYPEGAVNVVRAIVQSYLAFMDEIHKGTTSQIVAVLTQERSQVADRFAQRQAELLETRRSFADLGLRSDGKTLHPLVQRAVFFNEELIRVQKRRVELDARLAAIRHAMGRGENLESHALALADIIGTEAFTAQLRSASAEAQAEVRLAHDLITARGELAAMLEHLGPRHPEVLATQQRIQLAESLLRDYQGSSVERTLRLAPGQLGPWLTDVVGQKRNELWQQEQLLERQFAQTSDEAIQLTGQLAQIELLERDVKRLGDLNDVLLNQIASLDLQHSGQEIRAAVVQEPVLPSRPVSPRLSRVGIVALFGGFLLSLMAVNVMETLDDRFRSLEEIQQRLGTPVLAMVRQLPAQDGTGLESLAMYASPTSVESESFRTLRTALTLSHADARQIVVSSTEPGDGKTTVLANLGVCLAQSERRTLLIDADMRRPGLTNLLGMRDRRGLSEVLRSDDDLAHSAAANTFATGMENLDVMPAGPRVSNPAELLSSPRFSELLAWASSVYDHVLVDSPPALAASDVAIIGRLVDGVVLVMQPAKNRRRLVTRVIEEQALLKIPVLGLVLNRIGADEGHNYYYYQGGYYYGARSDDEHDGATPDAAEFDEYDDDVPEWSVHSRGSRHLTVPRRAA